MSKHTPGPRELALRAQTEQRVRDEEARQKADRPAVMESLKAATAEAAKKRGKLRKPKAKK